MNLDEIDPTVFSSEKSVRTAKTVQPNDEDIIIKVLESYNVVENSNRSFKRQAMTITYHKVIKQSAQDVKDCIMDAIVTSSR